MSEIASDNLRRNRLFPMNGRGYRLVCILLGIILLTAAVLKGFQLVTEPIMGKGILSSRWFLILLIEFELLLGFWLVSGLWTKISRRVAMGCFLIFAMTALYKITIGVDSCGCFGKASVNPWYMLLLDFAAVVALFLARPATTSSSVPPTRARITACSLMIVTLGGAAGVLLVCSTPRPAIGSAGDILGDSSFVLLEPEKWIGQRFPLLNYVDIDDHLDRGKWIVVLYHHDCPDCQKAVPRYKQLAHQWKGRPNAPHIALIEMPPYAIGQGLVSPDSLYTVGRLRNIKDWFITTPTVMVINAGKVGRVLDPNGEIVLDNILDGIAQK